MAQVVWTWLVESTCMLKLALNEVGALEDQEEDEEGPEFW